MVLKHPKKLKHIDIDKQENTRIKRLYVSDLRRSFKAALFREVAAGISVNKGLDAQKGKWGASSKISDVPEMKAIFQITKRIGKILNNLVIVSFDLKRPSIFEFNLNPSVFVSFKLPSFVSSIEDSSLSSAFSEAKRGFIDSSLQSHSLCRLISDKYANGALLAMRLK
mmetsp:Transcript_41328/g.54324  ORF Transcript_41328/g.54324 Transcript_41328/m.54324 type:complete len:168 (-) Transcript_41328:198-701(-)